MSRLVLLLALALAACSSAPAGNPDVGAAGLGDAALLVDGGTVSLDAGTLSPDAGSPLSDGGGLPGCAENGPVSVVSDPTKTDNACVFDRWLAELPSLSAADQRARVSAYLGREDYASSVPLRSGTRVVFVADAASGAPGLAGSFNGWDPTKGAMQPLFQSGFVWREESLGAGRHSYKFVYGVGSANEAWVRDPAARWLEWDGIAVAAPGAFNSVVYTAGASFDRGPLRLIPKVHSPELGNDRETYVWLPRGAFAGSPRYPALYVSDGNESITRGQFDTIADTTVDQNQAKPAILVFVPLHDQNERMDEYTFGTATSTGEKYKEFLGTTLRSQIDAAFPTLTTPDARGVAGASLGGLISAYTSWNHPEIFGLVGSQSGSFFWPEGTGGAPDGEALVKEIQAYAGTKPLRIYQDNGSPDDNMQCNADLDQVLTAKGYAHLHVVDAGAQHDWPYWSNRWPQLLKYLFPPN